MVVKTAKCAGGNEDYKLKKKRAHTQASDFFFLLFIIKLEIE